MSERFGAKRRNTGRATAVKGVKKGVSPVTAVVLTALSLLLPPVGVVAVWRARNLHVAARALLSVIAGVSMTCLLTFLWSDAQVGILPAPEVPQPAGYAEATPVPVPTATPTPDPASITPEPTAEPTPTPTPAPVIVYAVRGNATLYHKADSCDGQVNRRSLTLDEALSEGLAPCEKCSPPVKGENP